MQRLRKFSYITLGRLKHSNFFHGKSYLTSILESTRMHVFFLVDTTYCKTESDDPKDAIVYFYPPQVPESQLCALCCQMTGALQFFRSTFTCPKIIQLSRGKFAVKVVGNYFLSLGSSSDMPDKKLCSTLEFLYDIFAFYHHSIESVQDQCVKTNIEFTSQIQKIWKFLLESACTDERISWVAQILPRMPNVLPSVYLSSYHVLQACQRLPQVLGGCIVYNNRIVCTQLSQRISAYLCHFQKDLFNQMEDGVTNPFITTIFVSFQDIMKLSSLNTFSKVFKKQWHITGYNTEACMIIESNEADPSEVDSSFEDSTSICNQSSQFIYHNYERNVQGSMLKTMPELSWLSKSSSIPLDTSTSNASSMSKTLDRLTLDHKPEAIKVKSKSMSLLHSVAEESLQRLKLYDGKQDGNDDRPRYRRRKSKKNRSSSSNNIVFLSDGHDSKTEATTEEAIHSEKSVDSSFFEPKPLLESAISDTSHKSDSSSMYNTPSTNRNSTPLNLRISQVLGDIGTPNERKTSRMLYFPDENENILQALELCCFHFGNTVCFLLLESEDATVRTALSKLCLGAVEQLDAKLSASKSTSPPRSSSSDKLTSAVYCDHIWSASVDDKVPKTTHQLNDLQDHPTFKSMTVMNLTGVAYTHSSMTHNIYVENNSSGSTVAGIPSPQDVMARIPHLPKQNHDKMGYFLLK